MSRAGTNMRAILAYGSEMKAGIYEGGRTAQ